MAKENRIFLSLVGLMLAAITIVFTLGVAWIKGEIFLANMPLLPVLLVLVTSLLILRFSGNWQSLATAVGMLSFMSLTLGFNAVPNFMVGTPTFLLFALAGTLIIYASKLFWFGLLGHLVLAASLGLTLGNLLPSYSLIILSILIISLLYMTGLLCTNCTNRSNQKLVSILYVVGVVVYVMLGGLFFILLSFSDIFAVEPITTVAANLFLLLGLGCYLFHIWTAASEDEPITENLIPVLNRIYLQPLSLLLPTGAFKKAQNLTN